MSYRTIGSCSLCGGPVRVPTVWSSIFPPTPECFECHAVSSGGNGPVIPMRQAPPVRTYTDSMETLKRKA
jgi:hypothetical protein